MSRAPSEDCNQFTKRLDGTQKNLEFLIFCDINTDYLNANYRKKLLTSFSRIQNLSHTVYFARIIQNGLITADDKIFVDNVRLN